MIKIAIDAMGWDNWLEVTIPWTVEALEINPEIEVILFWNKKKILNFLRIQSNINEDILSRIEINHTDDDDNIPMDIKTPLTASLTHENSSMIKAIYSLKNWETKWVVSSWNTWALVSSSLRILKRLEKKGSFALTWDFPDINSSKNTLALDLWADINTTSTKLIKNTIMASIFLKKTRWIKKPKVWLIKSFNDKEERQDTFRWLKNLDLIEFKWYISPDKILDNNCDLIVIDGFKWNILLKTAEWVAKTVLKKAKEIIKQKVFHIILWLSIQKKLESEFIKILNKEIYYKENIVSNIPSITKNNDTLLIWLWNTNTLDIEKITWKIEKIIKLLKEKWITKPKIGIINIWTEEWKWRKFEKDLYKQLNESNLWFFKWFIEPDKLLDNECDIVITDKETWNIILKTIKWIIRDIIKKINTEIKNWKIWKNIIWKNKLKDRLKDFAKKTENWANLLWVNWTVIKSHWWGNHKAFCNAILVAYDSIKSWVIEKTKKELEKLKKENK